MQFFSNFEYIGYTNTQPQYQSRFEMIISHKLKLIFIKTKKVGGTSFEIALSKFCTDQDVITPISENDEKLRNALGYQGAQNYKRKGSFFLPKKRKKLFYNHMRAEEVQAVVDASIWESYKKFTIHRNPFDAIISRYFYIGAHEKDLTFEKFVLGSKKALLENSKIAPLSGPSKLDFYIPYHQLKSGFASAGLSYLYDDFQDIRTKSAYRPKEGTSLDELFSQHPHLIDFVSETCAEEIAHFNFAVPRK